MISITNTIYYSGAYATMVCALIVCIKEIYNIDRSKGLENFIIDTIEIVFTTFIGFSAFILLSWIGLIIVLWLARK